MSFQERSFLCFCVLGIFLLAMVVCVVLGWC